jgi:KDO2-lipid IV(A) lauroyltransferase
MKYISRLLRLLPYSIIKALLGCLAIFLYFVLTSRRKIGLKNIELALGVDRAKAKKILFHTYLYFAKMVSLNIKYLGDKKFIEKHFRIEGIENFEEALSYNKGVMFTTAHFGNFEMLVCGFAVLKKPINVMVRPLDNKALDKLVLDLRQSCGNMVVSSRLSTFDFLKMLQNGQIVGILADQYGGSKGLDVEFFGRSTKSSEGIALLSYKNKIPILPAYLKEEGKIFTIVIQKPIYPTGEPFRKATYTIMRSIYAEFENWIKKEPTKYLWMHNRWKT